MPEPVQEEMPGGATEPELVATVRQELGALASTSTGLMALKVAQVMSSKYTPPASISPLAKELSRLMAAALGTKAKGGTVSSLQERLNRRGA